MVESLWTFKAAHKPERGGGAVAPYGPHGASYMGTRPPSPATIHLTWPTT